MEMTRIEAPPGLDMPLGEAFHHPYPAVARLMASEDVKEGPRAFAEKREPNWQGR